VMQCNFDCHPPSCRLHLESAVANPRHLDA
jgi:hypothetical protein